MEQIPSEKDLRIAEEKAQASRNRLLLWGGIVLLIVGVIVGLVFLVKSSRGGFLPNVPIESLSASDTAIQGNKDAKVIFVEYSDFQCPACKSAKPYVDAIVKEYGDRIAFVYRNFPLKGLHPNAEEASWTAEAAAKQGKYWEMHDLLFANQEKWSGLPDPTQTFTDYAKNLGLDTEKFTADVASKEVRDKVLADTASGNTAQIKGTPSFFVNGTYVNISTFGDLTKAIDTALANVK